MARKRKIHEEENADLVKLSPEEEDQLDRALESIVDDDEELSENFRKKFKVIFEATVAGKVKAIREELEAEMEEESEELEDKVEKIVEESSDEIEAEIESLKDELEENLNKYLDYVVENWLNENRVAIEAGYKVKVAESIMSGLKKLVEENDIEVEEEDEEKFDELEEHIISLQNKYDALFERYSAEKDGKESLQKKIAVEAVVSEMTLSDSEKFKTLAENLSYTDNLSEYVSKLNTIKESYFSPSVKVGGRDGFTEMLREDVSGIRTEAMDSTMGEYLASLERMK